MKAKHILVLCLALFSIHSFAHDQLVHEAITVNAAESALNGATAFAAFIDLISADEPLKEATNAMVIGSFKEDYGPQSDLVGGWRSYNHFYDPTKSPPMGLTDLPWPAPTQPAGLDSFTWGSTRNRPGYDFGGVFGLGRNVGTRNVWSWQNARDLESHLII